MYTYNKLGYNDSNCRCLAWRESSTRQWQVNGEGMYGGKKRYNDKEKLHFVLDRTVLRKSYA